MSPNQIFVIWGVFATIFGVSSNALNFPSNLLSLDTSENKIKIELIDVKCDKNENGMQVNVVFSQPFDGIIYSQGFFNDPKCRYVSAGESEKSHNFVVPFEGCGSKPSCLICDSIDNILIIQQDEEVQGEFDTARKISCSRTGIEEEKKIFFKPFIVDMLDVVTVPTAQGSIDCWMDIQRGIYPQLAPISDTIKIGEALSVLVYLRDPKSKYDLTVRNCWAYDSEDFDDKKTGKVQLSDASGCTMKRKLLGSWRKTTKTGSTGASLLLHNTLRAFKFPDESQIYLKCDIEICRGTCAEAICDADEIHKVDCTVDPFNSKCIDDVESTTVPLRITTFTNKQKLLASTEPANSITVTTKRPSLDASLTERFSHTSTTVFDQESTTQHTLACGLGLRDIRCRRPQNLETTQASETTTTTSRETTTYLDSIQTNTIKQGFDSFCSRYSNSKRCTQRITEDLGLNVEILTFGPPSPFATVKYQFTTDTPTTILPTTSTITTTKLSPNCARNPNDYHCQQNEMIRTTGAPQTNEQPFICQGNNLDPRCPNPTPTNTPPTYLPSTTLKIINPRIEGSRQPTTKQPITMKPTKKFFICVPGSNDVNCDFEANKRAEKSPTNEQNLEKKSTAFPTRNQYTTKKPNEGPSCFVGSTNPECRKVSKNIVNSKPNLSTVKPQTAFTTHKSSPCHPDSLNPNCTKVATKKPQLKSFGTTTNRYISSEIPVIVVQECYEGSPDPACATKTISKGTTLTPQKKIYKTVSPTTTTATTSFEPRSTIRPQCYPGSKNLKCANAATTTETGPETTTNLGTTAAILETTAYKTIINAITKVPTPRCYPDSFDPNCKSITKKNVFPPFKSESQTTKSPASTIKVGSTAEKISKENLITKEISTTPASGCYSGSLDPRCSRATKGPQIATPKVSTKNLLTSAPVCYPGALDPRCSTKVSTSFGPKQELAESLSSTTFKSGPSVSSPLPHCYPGSFDPNCRQSMTSTQRAPKVSVEERQQLDKIQISTTIKPVSSINGAPPNCYPGSFDPRCRQSTTTTQRTPTVLVSHKQDINLAPTSTTVKPVPSVTTSLPRCYPGSFDSRCRQSTTTTTTQQTQTTNLISNTATTPGEPKFSPICHLGSLDPRCKTTSTTKPIPSIPSQESTVTTSVYIPKITTKSPSIPVVSITSRISVTKRPFTTVVPRRIMSSPQPFATRPSAVASTTENILCYPGSPIEGCKSTDQSTPSYCYPGSKDKRCPQLPPSFSTREPATYLPPFPSDTRHNRVKRASIHNNRESNEIVKFSLSFKPFSFS